MMWGWGWGWGWGGWLFMGLMMVLFWTLVVGGIVAVVRYVSPRNEPGTRRDVHGDEAFQLLAERFARGEIDSDEYTKRREILRTR